MKISLRLVNSENGLAALGAPTSARRAHRHRPVARLDRLMCPGATSLLILSCFGALASLMVFVHAFGLLVPLFSIFARAVFCALFPVLVRAPFCWCFTVAALVLWCRAGCPACSFCVAFVFLPGVFCVPFRVSSAGRPVLSPFSTVFDAVLARFRGGVVGWPLRCFGGSVW